MTQAITLAPPSPQHQCLDCVPKIQILALGMGAVKPAMDPKLPWTPLATTLFHEAKLAGGGLKVEVLGQWKSRNIPRVLHAVSARWNSSQMRRTSSSRTLHQPWLSLLGRRPALRFVSRRIYGDVGFLTQGILYVDTENGALGHEVAVCDQGLPVRRDL